MVGKPNGESLFLVNGDEIQLLDDQFHLLDSINIGFSKDISFSPNGDLVAIQRWDGTIELWDTEDWLYLREFPTNGENIIQVEWHPDGDAIAILQANSTFIEIWDTTSLEIIQTASVDPNEVMRVFEWSPNGDEIAIGFSNSNIGVWDLGSEQISVLFQEHVGEINDIQWSPDGEWVASSDVITDCHSVTSAFVIWVWNATTGEPLHSFDTLHCSRLNLITWSPDSNYLAGTTESGQAPFYNWQTNLSIWDISSGETVSDWEISDKDGIVDLAWQPDGDTILFRTGFSPAGGFGSVCASPFVGLINSSDAELIRYESSNSMGSVYDIGWHPSESLLATAGNDRNIHIWNSETSEPPVILSGHPCTVTHLAWNPTTSGLASTGNGGNVFLWDAEGDNILRSSEFNWSNVDDSQTFIWGSSGSQLLAFDFDGRGRIWNNELEMIYDFQLPLDVPFATVHAVNWRDDIPIIAIGSTSIELWLATETPSRIITFPESDSNPVQMQWNHTGEILASQNVSNTIEIWNAQGLLLNTLSFQHEIDDFLWHPQADWLAIVDSNALFIYDAITEDLVEQIEIKDGLLAWNLDGTRLASVDSSAIRVWEIWIAQ